MAQSSNVREGESLWGPALVLPSQLGGHCRPRSPEALLMGAVLEDAFLCIAKNVGAREPHRRHQLNDASAWFRSDSRDWPFAFLPLCDGLGLDATAVRQRVRRLLAHDAAATAQSSPPAQASRSGELCGRPSRCVMMPYHAHRPPSGQQSASMENAESAASKS